VETTSLHGRIDVDLFTCGGGPDKGNSMCPIFHSKIDDAFKYPWVGTAFYGNPEYTAEFITKTLQKAISDYSKDPENTSFMFVLRDWKSAPWYALLDQFQVVKTYPTGSRVFSCPSGTTFDTETLIPVAAEGGPDRVFINGTSWPVIVVTKSKLTDPVINPVKLLHARLGHVAPSTLKAAVRTCLHTGITATEQQISMQLPTGSCSVCTQSKHSMPTFHSQDQTWMEDHVHPFFCCHHRHDGPSR